MIDLDVTSNDGIDGIIYVMAESKIWYKSYHELQGCHIIIGHGVMYTWTIVFVYYVMYSVRMRCLGNMM